MISLGSRIRGGVVLMILGAGIGWSADYQFSTNLSAIMPDGGGIGTFVQHHVAGLGGRITGVTVSLELRGGWTGDLYAFLNFGEAHVVLLNRPGKTDQDPAGYGDRGVRVIFDDTAANGDVHLYRANPAGAGALGVDGILEGTWAPDGRVSDPDLVVDSDPRPNTLVGLNGKDANGTWTLFVADMATGAVHELRGWGLTIRTDAGILAPQLETQRTEGGFFIRFQSEAGVTYIVEAADQLPAEAWNPVGRLTGSGGVMAYGPIALDGLGRNFRVRVATTPIEPSEPRLAVTRRGGGLEIRWPGERAITYYVEKSERLGPATWQVLSVLLGTGEELAYSVGTSGPSMGVIRVRSATGGSDAVSPRLKVLRVAEGIELRVDRALRGHTYRLEATEDLAMPSSWRTLGSLEGADGELVFGPFVAAARFGAFRVSVR